MSIVKEVVEFIQEICYRNIIELRQSLYLLRINMLCEAFLNGLVDAMGHSHLVRNLHLHQALAMSAPAEPIRDISNFHVSTVTLIELGRLQNLPRGAQYETVYV